MELSDIELSLHSLVFSFSIIIPTTIIFLAFIMFNYQFIFYLYLLNYGFKRY